MTELDSLLAKVAEINGHSPWQPDGTGAYMLAIDDVAVNFIPLEETGEVLLYAVLAQADKEKLAKVAPLLLQMNHLFEGGEGASFAWDAEKQNCCLQRIVSVRQTDPSEWMETVERFVNAAERWIVLLNADSAEELEKPGTAASEQPAGAENAVPAGERTEPDPVSVSMNWLAV